MKKSIRNTFQRLWNCDSPRALWERVLLLLLTPPSWVYGAIQRCRRGFYRRGWIIQRRLDQRVVSVGGLRVGGSGKTPFARWMANRLTERGLRVAILTRGYGRDRSDATFMMTEGNRDQWNPQICGDEPYMLARSLQGVPIVVDSDRYRGGLAAARAFPVDVFLLDDGFQHLRLRRDCDILLLPDEDLTRMACLPKGPLREPICAVQDAEFVVRISRHRPGVGVVLPADRICGQGRGKRSVFNAAMEPGGLWVLGEDRCIEAASLGGEEGFAFCGIARPEAFGKTLEEKGLRIREMKAYPDHHRYSGQDHREILEMMSGYPWAVTTEKDAGKLARFEWPPGRLLVLGLNPVLSDERAFWERLEGCLFRDGERERGCPARRPTGG